VVVPDADTDEMALKYTPDSETCAVCTVSEIGEGVDMIVRIAVGVKMTVVYSVTTSLVQ
jgi:hypothetical protein